ncbi:MAG: electron transport complex subunit RsxE [Eubacteriales bacterium]
MQNFGTALKEGLITNNPVLVQLLGMCASLATSTSLINGVGMGLSTTAVLICSNIVISLLRKIIPNKIRIAGYIVVIASFVTIVDMLLKAYSPELSEALGVFIPLIVVNCIILGRAEAFASKNGVAASAVDGLVMGLGFTFTLSVMGIIREFIGAGTFLGKPLFGEDFAGATMFILPAGGFIVLGCFIATVQYLTRKGGKA